VLRMFDPEEITPATMTIPAIYFPAANETWRLLISWSEVCPEFGWMPPETMRDPLLIE
jgi:hypothetical protein